MTSSPTPVAPSASSLSVREAALHILVAFDIGFEIRMFQIPVLFGSRSRDPVGYNFLNQAIGRETQPIRIVFDSTEILIQGQPRTFTVYGTFFDVGALSLEFICPLHEDISQYPRLATDLQISKELVNRARQIAEEIYKTAKPSIVSPDFVPTPSVFVAFNVRRLDQRARYEKIVELLGPVIAKTMRLSDEPIGSSEVNRTLNPAITYSDEDVVFCSANVAVIFDETSSEVVDIFELCNMQSLELRVIDARLDRTLQSLYEENDKNAVSWKRFPNIFERQARRLNTNHLDSTIIAERVEQSFKFATDSYLVRIHELCVQKMFLASLSKGIDRKLEVIRDIITDQRDVASSIRMELLEWIIIALIAFETVPKIWSLFIR